MRLHLLPALGAEVKLPRVARVIALDVKHRFVHEAERDFRRHGFAFVIARGDDELPFILRLVLRAIRFHVHGQEMFRRRDDDLFGVREHLPVAHHGRAEEHIGHVFLVHEQVQQLHRAGHVDEAIVVKVFPLDREQHVAVR